MLQKLMFVPLHKVSILIPCYNEADHVDEIIAAIRAVDYGIPYEMVIVNDCSTDGSADKLSRYATDADLAIFHHTTNQGKGAALRTAIQKATGDVLIIQDADLEYNPQEIPKVIGPILQGVADVVYGSRFRASQDVPERVHYFRHRVGNGLVTLCSNLCTNLNMSDVETCYKAFRADVLKAIPLTENRFGVDPEITAKIATWRPRLKIYEVSITYQGRTYEEGKKIGVKDFFRALWCIVKYSTWRRFRNAPAQLTQSNSTNPTQKAA